MDDLISRQAAIKAICEDGTWLESQGCAEITMVERKQRDADILIDLPSVQPEQKHGKWIRLSNYLAQCSVCKDYIDNAISCGYNYCPNCGARMNGENNA